MQHDIYMKNITGVIGDEITGDFGNIDLTFPFVAYPDIVNVREPADTIFTGSGSVALKVIKNNSNIKIETKSVLVSLFLSIPDTINHRSKLIQLFL